MKYSPKNAIIVSITLLKFHGLERDCLGVPPRVRPAEEKVGTEGPASLTALSMAFARPVRSAPWIVSITVPERKILKVGILDSSSQHKV